MTVPAIAIKSLGSHYNRFNSLFMTAQAVGLNDFLSAVACPNRHRDLARCECVNILCTLPAFFKIIRYSIFMGQMTVYAFSDFLVRGVIPVFILRIHYMAVCTSFRSASTVGWRVAHKNEETE